MKTRLLTIVFIAMFSALNAQTIPTSVPKDGLVGWWPFNGNGNDETGRGNDLTANNGASFGTDRFGNINSSATLNGINQTFSKLNPNLLVGNSNRTLSCWISQSGISTITTSLLNLNNDASGDCFTSSSIQTSGSLSGGYYFWGRCNDAYWSHTRVLNKWYHLVLTYTNKQISFYVDNVLIKTYTLSLSLNTQLKNFIIGGGLSDNSQNGFWNGKIDDIAIYNRVLTNTEISALYTMSSPCTPPIARITNNTLTTELNCTTNSISLTASGGDTYTWDNGLGTASTVAITTPGTYSVTVATPYGCTDTASIVVTKNVALPNAIINPPLTKTLNCNIPSILLSAGGGSTYAWSNGSNTDISMVNTDGTYTVVVTAANGCTDTASIVITKDVALPTAVITPPSTTVLNCNTPSILLTANGGESYLWSNGVNTAINPITTEGTYTVKVTASNGCSDKTSISITKDMTVPIAVIIPKSSIEIKENESVVLSANQGNGYSYTWYKDGIEIATSTNSD